MKRKHLSTIQKPTPGTVGSETQNDTRGGEENLDNEFPEEAALSEGSDQEAVTYDLWGTNHGKETITAPNSPKKWSSEEEEDDNENSDPELSWEEDSSADESDGEGSLLDPDVCSKHELKQNFSSELEKLDYLMGLEKDPEMIGKMSSYKNFLQKNLSQKSPSLADNQRYNKSLADKGTEKVNTVLDKTNTDVGVKLLNVKPLPEQFFSVDIKAHSLSIAKRLEDIDRLISIEENEDVKFRMINQRKTIERMLNDQLEEVGIVNSDKKLTFDESISKRIGFLRNPEGVRNDDDEDEEEEEEEEEKDVDHGELLEEDRERPLSEVITQTVANSEEAKKQTVANLDTTPVNRIPPLFSIPKSDEYVKPLPSSTLAPPKDSDESEIEEIVEDEYEDYDTSDEEDIRNTVGNIPMRWYDDYDHLGYNWDGSQIVKPPAGDELDNFLRKMEDPDFWRRVKDPQTGQDVVLCNEDCEIIERLKNCKIPNTTHEEYGPWIEWFTSEVMQTPVRDIPDHKRSFIPSRREAKKVSKIVFAIKRGWIKPKKSKPKKKAVYMLWEDDNTAEPMRRIHNHIRAPKRSLPSHAESYNPPKEYLFDKLERQEWYRRRPSERKLHFLPQSYSSLKEVPAYEQYVQERFRRCLDLYLCPRTRKMKLLIEPDDLLPKLPSPRDLQPFPTTQSLVYEGHTEMVRTISVESKGQYLASGSDDLTVKLWEVATGRCIRTISVGGIVRSVSWCPNGALSLVAVAADKKLLLINPCVGDILVVKKTDALLKEQPEQDVLVSDRLKNAIQWEQATGDDWKKGIRVIINHFKEVKQVTWHGRGDYFASVMPDAQNRSVIIHQVSKRRSQIPFSRSKGLVQCVLFHPIRPLFFVATQKFVRIYDLVKQTVLKKLFSNAKWISTMAIHPAGDNLLVGTYDRKVLWFDLDLSTKPYQTLRVHSGGIRGVAYHRNYPLFATSSDDSNIIVSHGMVYNDLLQNALIVPLKKLSFHEKVNDFSVFDVVFHPTQPWLFSTGADSTIRLYS